MQRRSSLTVRRSCPSGPKTWRGWRAVAAVALVAGAGWTVLADGTPQALPFSQDWTNGALITANDDWSGVPGIEGYRGDGLASATAVDPQTVLAADDTGVIDVNANQANPNTFATGGVSEFAIADPVVALQGSATARAPYVRLTFDTQGHAGIRVRYNARDIDGSADNAVQPLALHYRVHELKVIEWLLDMDLDAASERAAANL